MKTKSLIIAIISSVLLGTSITTAANFISGPVSGGKSEVSGCVIRFSDANAMPSIYANSTHQCAGVESVTVDASGALAIYQPPTKNPILFAVAQVDETLASRGIIVGPSGGNNRTRYYFYDTKLDRKLNLRKKSDRMRLQGKTSNLWVGWLHDAS